MPPVRSSRTHNWHAWILHCRGSCTSQQLELLIRELGNEPGHIEIVAWAADKRTPVVPSWLADLRAIADEQHSFVIARSKGIETNPERLRYAIAEYEMALAGNIIRRKLRGVGITWHVAELMAAALTENVAHVRSLVQSGSYTETEIVLARSAHHMKLSDECNEAFEARKRPVHATTDSPVHAPAHTPTTTFPRVPVTDLVFVLTPTPSYTPPIARATPRAPPQPEDDWLDNPAASVTRLIDSMSGSIDESTNCDEWLSGLFAV